MHKVDTDILQMTFNCPIALCISRGLRDKVISEI